MILNAANFKLPATMPELESMLLQVNIFFDGPCGQMIQEGLKSKVETEARRAFTTEIEAAKLGAANLDNGRAGVLLELRDDPTMGLRGAIQARMKQILEAASKR